MGRPSRDGSLSSRIGKLGPIYARSAACEHARIWSRRVQADVFLPVWQAAWMRQNPEVPTFVRVEEHPGVMTHSDESSAEDESGTGPRWKAAVTWLQERKGSALYARTEGPAQWLKALVQMLIGVGTVITIAILVWFPHLRSIGIAELALRVIGTGLALAAVVELTYTLFTGGPDEAIDPLILGLSSFILIKISEPGTGLSVSNAGTIILLVVALAGLFSLRAIFIGRSDTKDKPPKSEGSHK